jgi:putative heme-binding domain-containing protein
LYVADFYNRIIGHYEVDLKHPGRDKDRGRIWRIVWQGPDGKTVPPTPAQSSQLSHLSRAGSVSAAPVLTIRQLASQALWRAEDRATVIRALIPNPALPEPDRSILVRAAVEALVAHPHPDDVPLLVKLIQDCPQDDTHLRHAARVALRNALRDADGWVAANEADPAIIADVALGVPSAKAASYLLEHLSVALDPRFCEHIGRYGNDTQAIHAAESLAARPPSDVSRTLRGLQALARGVAARGAKFPAEAATQAEAVCEGALRSSDPNHWSLAAELASLLKLVSQYGQLVKLAGRDGPARGAVFSALVAIDPVQSVPTIAAVLMDPATAAPAREQAAQVLGVANTSAARDALIRALPTAPATLAGVIAAALISSPEGASALLDAVQAGKASARLLQDKAILGKLQTIQQGKFKPRIAELTRGLPSPDAKLTQLLKARLSGFDTSTTDPEVGRLVFARHCANCHQLGGQGAKVGPQLDGIGNRGVERLMEDILDPNRNVDEAFRAVVLDLADGRSVTGLLLREEGQVLIVADQAGRELRIPGGEVEKRTRSLLSPMPSNLDTVLTEPEFYHLVRYLLNQQVK